VSTRLGRYILQELIGLPGRAGALAATAVMCGVPAVLLLLSSTGSYRLFWTLFGTSNQLLAGLSMLGITVWLKRSRRRYWYTLAPTIFLLAMTIWSLLLQARGALKAAGGVAVVNGAVAVALVALAGVLVVFSTRALRART
jgi:carbon starvation protein